MNLKQRRNKINWNKKINCNINIQSTECWAVLVPVYLICGSYREKSLHNVAMVAKFLDDNKPKTSLKKWIRTVSNFNKPTQFHLFVKCLRNSLWLNAKVLCLLFRKRKFLCCVHQLHRVGAWNKEVSCRKKRSVMHVQSFSFANINLSLFCCSHRCCLCPCLTSLLLWSRIFATVAMWAHSSLYYPLTDNILLCNYYKWSKFN